MLLTTRTLLFYLFCWIKWSSSMDIPEEVQQPPTITVQSPKRHVVYPTDDFIIKCEARGNPAPNFTWTKDGKEYVPSQDPRVTATTNSGTFVIKNSNGNLKSFQGKYRCFASNDLGVAISEEIVFITAAIPRFPKESTKHFEVEEGDAVVLPCNPPSGPLPLNIYWMTSKIQRIQQNSRASQGLNGDLYFSNVQSSDSREDYLCFAHFSQTRTIAQKEPISLIVMPFVLTNQTESSVSYNNLSAANSIKDRPPRFLTPSGSSSKIIALRGETLQLECIAEGLPTPQITWAKIDGDMPKRKATEENFNKTLKIVNVTELDDGKYECKAENAFGVVKHAFSITVEAAPYWIKKPRSKVYFSEENAELECEVGGQPQPEVQWKVNGKPLNETKTVINRKISQGVITLTDLQLNDSAVYQCEASNKHGSVLANAVINVLNLAPMMLTPDDQKYIAVEGKSARLHCKVFGSPTPTIFWLKEDMEIVLKGENYFVHENGTLEIKDVQSEDGGFYVCLATNILGNDTTTCMLEVRVATEIVLPPEDLMIPKSEVAQFKCHAAYDSAFESDFELSWKQDGYEIYSDQTENDRIIIDGDILQINDVSEDDEGTYTCVARTSLDMVTAEAKLVVLDVPEPPEDLKLTDLQNMNVRLDWNPGDSHNSPIIAFIVEETTFELKRWHEKTRVDGNTTSVTLQLSPYVTYQFRISAVNEVGKSHPSQPSEKHTTPSAAPEKNPKNVKGEGTNIDNMKISWEPLKPIDWNGPGLRYKVSWRRQGANTTWNEEVVNKHHYFVTNTSTFVPYDIKVQAINDVGSGPNPKVVTGYSGEDIPEAAPLNVAVEIMNSTLIKVTWSEVPKEKIRGHLEGYKIVYWKIKSLLERRKRYIEKHVLTFNGQRSHGMVPGLEPYSEYGLIVMVFNRKGDGPQSGPIHFKTPEGVPEQPAFLQIANFAKNSVTLMWGPPAKPNGILTGYLLKYQLINDTEEIGSLNTINITDPDTTKVVVSDLDTSSKYKFYLSAYTRSGSGKLITEEGTTVMEGVPVLLNVSSSVSATYANISWIPGMGHAASEFYVAYMNNRKGKWKISDVVNVSQNFHILEGLEPGTEYTIRLMAKNWFDNSSIFEDVIETRGKAYAGIHGGISTQGWFIGLMCAVALLTLILLIACFIKRNKGGKYSVKDKEDAGGDPEAQPMKEETFGEYGDNEDKPLKESQQSLNEVVKPTGSDDSLAVYEDGGPEVQFNEDGSFIGQYRGNKENDAADENGSSIATSPMKA
ncbi:neural cell adhesion molecule L1-like protein isoform X2 [Stegostoma tigrinum]|uniref:neural cell adhesion molecule L1-like protein isoform X2 n=1 Tax=Stegostoma tigrinum TaxID=3053191 RepID=UPI002870368B|nr:neural cell adhesion molecule L1-like protein isoform X2 [Stegostoma tigrinum]